MNFQDKTVFILGASSDIGVDLAGRFAALGARVVGTYRDEAARANFTARDNLVLFPCDVGNPASVGRAVAAFAKLDRPWDVFISCVGTLEPIGRFFSLGFEEWENSVRVNSLAQLRVLHALHPHRRPQSINHAVFFAGGGTNSPFRNYSAYCLGKIALIKMCELLDDEDPLLNAVIIGTGFVNTKIHRQTLQNPEGAGPNHARTLKFIESAGSDSAMADIFACINWCVQAGREDVGGRNFSMVNDSWRNGGRELLAQLAADRGKFKLRRRGNT